MDYAIVPAQYLDRSLLLLDRDDCLDELVVLVVLNDEDKDQENDHDDQEPAYVRERFLEPIHHLSPLFISAFQVICAVVVALAKPPKAAETDPETVASR